MARHSTAVETHVARKLPREFYAGIVFSTRSNGMEWLVGNCDASTRFVLSLPGCELNETTQIVLAPNANAKPKAKLKPTARPNPKATAKQSHDAAGEAGKNQIVAKALDGTTELAVEACSAESVKKGREAFIDLIMAMIHKVRNPWSIFPLAGNACY